MNYLKKIREKIQIILAFQGKLEKIQLSLGRIESRQLEQLKNTKFNDHEMQVFSQWGEDGLIQYLIKHVAIDRPIFVEFGVEKYIESNTRFLLCNNNWSGLVIDGSIESINYIKNDVICWQHDLKTECAFIDKNNINELIRKNGISGDIGLLSIDIDGNDYWIWKEITVINPRIVICEYNNLWGNELAVTIPYNSSFERNKAHYSNLYFGASISAFVKLGKEKGYSLIGSNNAGNNIFFVRNDLLSNLIVQTAQQAYIKAKFSEARDRFGNLNFLNFDERLNEIKELPLVNVNNDEHINIKMLFNII